VRACAGLHAPSGRSAVAGLLQLLQHMPSAAPVEQLKRAVGQEAYPGGRLVATDGPVATGGPFPGGTPTKHKFTVKFSNQKAIEKVCGVLSVSNNKHPSVPMLCINSAWFALHTNARRFLVSMKVVSFAQSPPFHVSIRAPHLQSTFGTILQRLWCPV
jgi:hypothetical protein